MRHIPAALALTLALAACCGALLPLSTATAAQAAAQGAAVPAEAPPAAEVREYIKLFGYREMLEVEAHRQLDSLIELARAAHKEIEPDVFDVIQQELSAQLMASADEAEAEMVVVFQRRFSRADVAYLIVVGRDPRMQKVVRLQPQIAQDMESIGERLAEGITAKAGPRIEERLRLLEGGQRL